ncbi:MAG: hypothetical protein HY985_19440, partial [Magnetospirillum sp.]|nr:hypothetical protein [Magnetospirillum sp.]
MTASAATRPRRPAPFAVDAAVGIWVHPAAFFDRVAAGRFLAIAVALQVLRWLLHAAVTAAHFAAVAPPALFPVPFGIDLVVYRSWQAVAFFPFGLCIVALVAWTSWRLGRRHATRPMSPAKTLEVVCLAWFAPWLPTLALDNLLLSSGWAIPLVVVPLHSAVVAGEAWL